MDNEKLLFLKQAAQNKLINFCELINPKWETVWFHDYIANKLTEILEKIKKGEKVRVILTLPPRHGKSQLSSIYFPAWALGKYPDLKFILATYGAELSEKMGLQTRDVISSEPYQFIFPGIELRQDQKAKAKWMTNKNGSYTAVGAGGAITGVGGNVIIIDDLTKSRDEAESETVQQFSWDYYRSTLYSRLEGYGAVIVIMQRWNQKDLVARLLEEDEKVKAEGGEGEGWEVINFPAIAEEDEFDSKGQLLRTQGEPLWPSKFPIPVLENIKRTAGIYNWSSQYMQDPIATENQEFKDNTFKYFKEEDIKDKYVRYYTLVDPAIGQKKTSDNTVVLTIAKEVNGPNIYRIREDAGHFTPSQTVDLIFLHQTAYRSDVFIETVQYQQALKFAVLEEQKKKQIYFIVKELKASQNKEVRIRGLIPLYQAGVIYHRTSDTEYERELLTFPNGRRDDRCFIAGTKVATLFGDKNIEDIKIGDMILTPFGFTKVVDSQCTGEKEVINNIGLIGTFDHKVFNKNTNQFDCLSQMAYNQVVTIKDFILWNYKKQLYLMEKNTNLWGGRKDIIYVSKETQGIEKVLKDFMLQFGKNIMEKKYQKALLFTIRIITNLTIPLIIYNVYRGKNMLKYIKDQLIKQCSLIWQKLDQKQKNGMDQQKGKNGIVNMLKIILNKNLKLNVLNVSLLNKLVPYIRIGSNSVVEDVHNQMLESQVGMTLSESVSFVVHHGKHQSILRQDFVQKNAHTMGKRKVFNITTAQGVYYANGILVSNCDVMAYCLQAMDNTGGASVTQKRTSFRGYFNRVK